MKANAKFLAEDDGVADVVGTILMVSITVTMMVGLSILVLSFEGPTAKLYADMQVDIEPGDLAWGTGNERVVLRHIGGEAIPTDDAKLVILINGSAQQWQGDELGQDFADGSFSIGDSWSMDNLTIAGQAEVQINFVDTGHNQMVASNRLIADLSLASSVPPVTTFVQDFYIVGGTGQVSDFGNAQSASDSGASASLDEVSSPGGSASSPHLDPGAVDDSAGVSSPANTLLDDQIYTTMDGLADRIAVDGFSVPADVLTITDVRLGFEARAAGGGGNDPVVRLSYSNVPLATDTPADFAVVGNLDLEYETTITGDKIAWTTSNIENMIVQVERMSADPSYKDADIDHIYVEIDYIQVNQWDLDVMFNFTGIPTGSLHEVQVRYEAANDDYTFQAWNGVTWNTRGSMTADTPSLFTYRLTTSEYNSGDPRIRFIDLDADGGQGTLNIDYARVQTV